MQGSNYIFFVSLSQKVQTLHSYLDKTGQNVSVVEFHGNQNVFIYVCYALWAFVRVKFYKANSFCKFAIYSVEVSMSAWRTIAFGNI